MTRLAQKFKDRFYQRHEHPYMTFEKLAEVHLPPGGVLLDAGCGRTAPVLRKYSDIATRLIGVDLVDPRDVAAGIEYHQADLANLPVEDASVDLIISRSVFEHLVDPVSVYREMHRVLKPGGKLIFLTANIWDYGTAIARIVPNRFHARIVNKVEGRAEEDTFPTAYKTNSRSAVDRLAQGAGFRVHSFDYLNQYPNYFMFNAALFLVGVAYERVTSAVPVLKYLRGWILVTLQKT
ncbi:class I SAM-dependent methyltransferase [Hydrogenophaga sp. BPS33]|uniref:class I SAM-dependent methyltransferase n=1 Tax=Hydrogenophaga sp. BPS33 TaxID=2651974 RepID=UPI00131F9AB0|nr:methyltransferase domain-containing protein [Hydrogenophaga sp. BPS33]QHE85918.1 methyltransferase domain-containing protein [Hydrogenophaga sp. BPS33]